MADLDELERLVDRARREHAQGPSKAYAALAVAAADALPELIEAVREARKLIDCLAVLPGFHPMSRAVCSCGECFGCHARAWLDKWGDQK